MKWSRVEEYSFQLHARVYFRTMLFGKGVFIPVVLMALSAASCGKKAKPIPGRLYEGVVLSEPYTIDVAGDSTDFQKGIDSIALITDHLFDLNNPSSTMAQFNAFSRTDSAFRFVDSTKFFGIVWDLTRDLNRKSNQLYDPSTGPLRLAWLRLRIQGLGGEPNLDSLYQFVGFDGAKADLMEATKEDGYSYLESRIRKADPRIYLDFSNIARAYALDKMAEYLTSKNVAQFRISCGNKVITHGFAVAELNIVNLGISGDSTDQKIRMTDRAFSCKTIVDKQYLVDPTYGYPVDNEFVYVGVSAPTLAEAEAFAETFMMMGYDQAAKWYDENIDSDIQSFIVIKRGDEITTASTEGFDVMLVVPDSLQVPTE